MENKKERSITIELIKEEAKEKDDKGNVVTAMVMEVDEKSGKEVKTDKPTYIRNDINGLMGLFNMFDTKTHAMAEWKTMLKIKDKIMKCYLDDLDKVELTLDQASFLKIYLSEINKKDGKNVVMEDFKQRTLFGILEQLF